MINIKVIKTQSDYEEALSKLEELMLLNPAQGSEESDQLQLLATLIEAYEENNFPSALPSPVEAIQFRMEQLDLKPSDLEPFIGGKSKVSEVLSGKRSLSLSMIRSLEKGLGIPAKVLIQDAEESDSKNTASWTEGLRSEVLNRLGNVSLDSLFTFRNNEVQLAGLLRQSNYRTAPLTDKNALAAWFGCVLKRAEQMKVAAKYRDGTVDLAFMREVAKISTKENAPKKVQEFLGKHGIILVIEPHFKKTRLDGAAVLVNQESPIIGLTLRFDRLDSFWFTLMHELAHIALHKNNKSLIFYDELEKVAGIETSEMEKEADDLASEALIPDDKWEISAAKYSPSRLAASALASEVGVHISIVAGKIRYENDNWSKLTKIITDSKVRNYFSEVAWR